MSEYKLVPVDPTEAMVEAAYGVLVTSTMVNHNSVYVALDQALAVAPPAQPEAESEDGPCKEADGCPAEMAVLKRFWREHQTSPDLSELRGLVDRMRAAADSYGPESAPEPDENAEATEALNEWATELEAVIERWENEIVRTQTAEEVLAEE